FYRRFGGIGKRARKHITQEHIAFGNTHHIATAAQRLEYLKALVQGEHDTFLSSTYHMAKAMTVEIKVAQLRARIAILENPLGTVAKRMENQTFTANGHFFSQTIQ